MKRSDKIARSDFGQPKAGPQGGVQGWTPQIRETFQSSGLCPRCGNRNQVFEIARKAREPFKAWIPAFAGMTEMEWASHPQVCVAAGGTKKMTN